MREVRVTLINLNWLDDGVYPPRAEKKRIDRYKLNEQLFMSEHTDALREYFHDIARRTRKKDYQVDTVINYQQLLSKKTADFVCGEPPEIETELDTDALDALLDHQRWGVKLYEAFIDVSRFGNAVLKILGNRLTAVSPAYWFPIVDPTDLKTVTRHVIAYPVEPDESGAFRGLYAEIHDIGGVEVRRYAFDGDTGRIGALQSSAVSATGLDDFAVQVLTNITHSGSIYGVDDYGAINSIVAKIMWRLHCIDTVLDKHSEPSVSGPSSALSYDEKFKAYYLDLGNYFTRNNADDPDVKYITWDGGLDSAYKEIELLLNQLYTISEMGQAFMEGGGGGEASSGTALKLRMVSPRIKAARLVGINDGAVKKVIALLAAVNGLHIKADEISLTWKDGLPDDEIEQLNALVTATGGPVMSRFAALKRMGQTDEEADAELEQMREEQAASMPAMLGLVREEDPFSGGNQ